MCKLQTGSYLEAHDGADAGDALGVVRAKKVRQPNQRILIKSL